MNGYFTRLLAREVGIDPSKPMLVSEAQAYLCLAWPSGAVAYVNGEPIPLVESEGDR